MLARAARDDVEAVGAAKRGTLAELEVVLEDGIVDAVLARLRDEAEEGSGGRDRVVGLFEGGANLRNVDLSRRDAAEPVGLAVGVSGDERLYRAELRK